MDHLNVVIRLTQGFVAVVSSVDFERVRKFRWHVHKSGGSGRKAGQPYARTNMNGKKVYMHRFLADADDFDHVDHVNFQTLDNRRENLKKMPPKENILKRRNLKTKQPLPLLEGDKSAD